MRYCQYCGAQLEDGAQCTCAESQNHTKRGGNFQGALKGMIDYVKGYFVNPNLSSDMKSSEDRFEVAVCLGGSFVLSIVILMMFLSGQAVSFINKSIGAFDSSYRASFPFGAALLTGIIIAIIILALSWGALLLCDKLAGKEMNVKKCYVAVATNLPFPIAFVLVGSIISIFSIKVACLVISLVSISWIVLGLSEVQERLGALNESKKNLFVSMAIILVINLVVCYITYKLMMWTVGTIKIDGERISKYMSNFLNMILQGFM